ncbi:NACHT domain-containing protein [Streptomyces sp. NPDC054841]
MNTPAGDRDPSQVHIDVEAHDASTVNVAARDIYITHPVARDDEQDVPVRASVGALVRVVAPALLLVTGVALIGAAYFRGGWSIRGALLLAGLACVATVVPLVRSGVRRRRQARLRHSPDLARRLERQLNGAAKQLSGELLAEWEREEKLRRIPHPGPLPVRWENEDEFTDHWSSIRGDNERDERVDLSGRITDIAEVYSRVPSGRLLVLGDAGAGKSVLALRFALDRLRRAAPGDRVPVLLPLASWDPEQRGLESWAADRLIVDHPALAARTVYGETVAMELLRTRRLLPVLDGFDEMRPDVQAEAVRRIRAALRQDDRFVLTSRVSEYRAATEEADVALPAAAAVRIQPLSLDELADYLRRTARRRVGRGTVSTKWDPVFARLRASPGNPQKRVLRSVLSTPLMTSLARIAYSETDRDPVELLDGRRFPTREAIEAHLLDQLVPAVTDRAEQTTRWLSFLAQRMDSLSTQDLAWWQLSPGTARFMRTLGVTLALSASTALMWWLYHDRPTSLFFLFEMPAWVPFGLLCLVSVTEVAVGSGASDPSPRHLPRPGRSATARFVVVAVVLLGTCFLYLWLSDNRAFQLVFTASCVLFAICTGVLRRKGRLTPSPQATPAPTLRTLQDTFDRRLSAATADSPKKALRGDRLATMASLGLVNTVTGGPPIWRAAVLMVLPVLTWSTSDKTPGAAAVGPGTWAVTVGVTVLALAVSGVLMSSWVAFVAARVWPWVTGQIPWRLLDFLDGAHQLGILRQSGSTYRFRHARLQERLTAPDGHAAAHPRPATGASRSGAVAKVRSAVSSLASLVIIFGAGAMWVGFDTVLQKHEAGPRKTVPSACELLDRRVLEKVFPDLSSWRSNEDPDFCKWSSGDANGNHPLVGLRTELYEPGYGYTAVQSANQFFDSRDEAPLVVPWHTRYPAGLGDEAISVIKYGDARPVAETTVRVDNLLVWVSYEVTVDWDSQALLYDEGHGRPRLVTELQQVPERLARTVVTDLGP